MKSQAAIARELAPLVGKGNVRSTTAFLSQILRGERGLPEAWKEPLMTALGIKTESELVAMYPKMRADVTVAASSSFVVTITQSEPSTVNDSSVAGILTLVAALKKHGISLKVTVEPTE